jgi:hypothetical protein
MSNREDSFISHLIEMRDRLLRAVLGVVILFVVLFPWAQDLYALLAKPMLASLPQGGQMIATEVTTPFFVPMKVTMMAAFLLALPGRRNPARRSDRYTEVRGGRHEPRQFHRTHRARAGQPLQEA